MNHFLLLVPRDLLHARNQHLHTLQTKPLLRSPLLSKEGLKADGPTTNQRSE